MKKALNDAIKRFDALALVFPDRLYFSGVLNALRSIDQDSQNLKEVIQKRLTDLGLKVHHLNLLQDKDSVAFDKQLEWQELTNTLREIMNS